jgi:hypothetical protein
MNPSRLLASPEVTGRVGTASLPIRAVDALASETGSVHEAFAMRFDEMLSPLRACWRVTGGGVVQGHHLFKGIEIVH